MKRIETEFSSEVLFRNSPKNYYPGAVFRAKSAQQYANGKIILHGYGNVSKSSSEEYGKGAVLHEKTTVSVLTDAGIDLELWAVYIAESEARSERYRLEEIQRDKELRAEALLRKAAPDLLEALQSCLDYGCMTGDKWVIEKAQAAIAKAKPAEA